MDQVSMTAAQKLRHGSSPSTSSDEAATLANPAPPHTAPRLQQEERPLPKAFGTRTTSTMSNESVRTIRGALGGLDAGEITPDLSASYPFPIVSSGAGQPGTPKVTPGAHEPFTTLSPTVTPTPAKAAKHQISQEFRASGLVRASAAVAPSLKDLNEVPTARHGMTLSKPNLVEVATHLQSELGLPHWWHQVSRTLREHFGAERATLAVATDATDVENVPWAQLATFWDGEDDDMSRVTNDPQSSRSSLRDVGSPAHSSVDREKPPGSGSTGSVSQHKKASGLMNNVLPSRPRLETRHSYAGYPSRHKPTASDTLLQPSSATSIKRPLSPIFPSGALKRDQGYGGNGLNLNEELLRRHEDEDPALASIGDEFPVGLKALAGNILQPPQPLESEADPLITASGVLKLLGRDRPVILTREYLSHDAEIGESAKETQPRQSPGKTKPKRSPGVFGLRSTASRTTKRRNATPSSKDSLAVENPLPRTATKLVGRGPVYEDYEQFPGTPWAQSPAPSPAARAESDDNPFFANQPDPDAFADSPPEQSYAYQSQIAAIGIDRSRTIIQVPIIHPSARLSHVMNSRTIRDESRTKLRKNRGQGEQRNNTRNDSHLSENAPSSKRIPIAILSILASKVPYPAELIDSLTEMAPLLAASFYAARSHSNILLELSAISGRRRHPGDSIVSSRDISGLSGLTGSISLALDRSRDRLFSPASPISSTSASTQSTTNFAISRENTGFHSAISSPIIDTSDEAGPKSFEKLSAGTEDSAPESGADYFSRKIQGNDKARSPSTPNRSSEATRASVSGGKKRLIHSYGASFATTQPSLPSATASVMNEPTESQTPSELSSYKEPSSSVLRTMIDNGATQQFIAEPEHGRLIWANSKFMAYRNAPKNNIHEQLWSNIYPKDILRFQREWNKSLESGEQLSHQVRLKRFDGQYRYFHVRFLPLKDRYGVTKYWHGQAMDIHDLHEAEVKAAKSKEKSASEARYRAIANSLPVIVFAASVPSGMTFANTQWLSYSGQDLEEALGFGFLEHVHPEDLVKCRFPGFDPTAQATPPLPRKSSAPPLARNDSSVSSTGESEETNVTVKGATPVKETSGELDIPNELLRQLADDGIILCARDQQGNLSITTEMRLKNRKGEYRWHLVQGSYIDSVNFGQGEAQWFIACTDISNQKQNEAKIQQANSALEDVNSALEKEMKQKMNYLSSMSHEIRTPLNGIIGNLQFLINSGLDESAADWAHGAQEAARNMHDLINDILDLSKAEANMLQLASHWFNTRGLMEQALDMLNSKAAEKGIELTFECDEDVPQSIKGDSQRIRQVLLNLVGNAIKFTQVGEVTIKCDMLKELPLGSKVPEARPEERFVRWSITDTGSGFTSEDRKLLFKQYSQLKNKNTRDSGGTGLGLILCKTMVTLHGGAIDASSKPGLGSTFTFFARFKVRPGPGRSKGHVPLAALTPDVKPTSPTVRSITASESRDSPSILSDSSSSRSITSAEVKSPHRSPPLTTESALSMKLTLPPYPTAPRSPDVSLSNTHKRAEPVTSPKIAGLKALSPRLSAERDGVALPPRGPSLQRTVSTDLERANFRPPMISTLVVCSAKIARRVTCEQIRRSVPQSVPCNIAAQPTVEGAFQLLTGSDPIVFTHIVLRLASDSETVRAVKRILAEPQHSRVCIVVLLHQVQAKYLQKNAPELNLEELSKKDRLKLVMKPAHTFKLAKIFDPFNENLLKVTDPKEAKRQEEKRLQKEAYDLFKTVLGNKGIKVLAVEDNGLQMNILHNFLAKICCLDVTKAWNGQECFDLYKEHEPGYYSVIITDIEMPIMDGLTMCRKIREFEAEHNLPPVNLVSLSAHGFSEGWNQASEAGFSHYCSKPVQFRDLGHILLDLTDPSIPHKFLRDRQMPRHMLKKLGLLRLDEEDSDEEEEC